MTRTTLKIGPAPSSPPPRPATCDAHRRGVDAELHLVTTGVIYHGAGRAYRRGRGHQRLREVMAAGECDIAVHSFKDLPTALDERFHSSRPRGADVGEALIARDGLTLDTLPEAPAWALGPAPHLLVRTPPDSISG